MTPPDSPLAPIRPPLSVPCVVCGEERLYVLEEAPPTRRSLLFRWVCSPVGTPRCPECGAR